MSHQSEVIRSLVFLLVVRGTQYTNRPTVFPLLPLAQCEHTPKNFSVSVAICGECFYNVAGLI